MKRVGRIIAAFERGFSDEAMADPRQRAIMGVALLIGILGGIFFS